MNENLDLTKILKDCPKGFEFYSSIHGKLLYSHMYVNASASIIYFKSCNHRSLIDGSPIIIEYSRDGRFYPLEGECTLFPSKDQRDWSKFTAPWYKKEKFDPKTLKPFDKIITRIDKQGFWCCELFSFIEKNTNLIKGCGAYYKYCIPYNDETKYLVGTTNEAPEYYRYWEK